jgi:transcriptional regulator with XRE-family HTH domain
MSLVRLSGAQLHAARVLAGISHETLAERAGLSRYTVMAWEKSSHAVPPAMYQCLCRAVSVLESEGVVFSPDGVSLDRPRPTMKSTILNREVAAP